METTGTRSPLKRTVGSNQVGMRQFNERIVLQAIRSAWAAAESRRGPPHASFDADSVDDRRASHRRRPARKAGARARQDRPAVGADRVARARRVHIGIKVGRRSLDVLAMDFAGHVVHRDVFDYAYPDPRTLFPALEKETRARESDARREGQPGGRRGRRGALVARRLA